MTYMIHIYLVLFIYSVNYLFVTLGLFCFTFIPSHRRRPENSVNRLHLVLQPLMDVLRTSVMAGSSGIWGLLAQMGSGFSKFLTT